VKRALWVAAGVTALAVTLLLVGGLGLFGIGGASPRVADTVKSEPGSALAPAPPADKLDATIDSLQARAGADAADWRANASLGLAYLHKARLTANPSYYSKAAAALTASLRVERRDNFEGLLGRGILAGARHDFAGALRWGRAAAGVNPYNGDARGVIADSLVELGRYAPARRALQHMVDLRPDLASFARVSYWRELHGDTRGAVKAMTQAFEAVGGAGPDAAWASYQLGELFFNSGRLPRASFAYRRAAFLDPGSYLPRAGLAKVAAARGRTYRAIKVLRRVVTTYPAPVYVMQLGDLYASVGRDDDASRQYALVDAEQRLFASNGVEPDVEIVNFYSDHGRRARWTLATARRAWRERPSVRVADALAWALHAAGRPVAAARYARFALRLGTRDANYYFHAGMIQAAAGHPAQATRYLRRALRINPHFSVLHADAARRALRSLVAS
jgi:tetratricopeptide (TPR) repeat protein